MLGKYIFPGVSEVTSPSSVNRYIVCVGYFFVNPGGGVPVLYTPSGNAYTLFLNRSVQAFGFSSRFRKDPFKTYQSSSGWINQSYPCFVCHSIKSVGSFSQWYFIPLIWSHGEIGVGVIGLSQIASSSLIRSALIVFPSKWSNEKFHLTDGGRFGPFMICISPSIHLLRNALGDNSILSIGVHIPICSKTGYGSIMILAFVGPLYPVIVSTHPL